jgi:tetraprenyl-beta-curcumene synthase
VSQPNTCTAIAFASAARRYWLGVFPVVQREIAGLRHLARGIPDPVLRSLALDAQRRKSTSLEGAAAFAAFVPRERRTGVTRLLVGLQCVFDYADTLMEQPSEDPAANAAQLHHALLVSLEPDRPHLDYYKYHPHQDDGGYLAELVDVCRHLIEELPSYRAVNDVILAHAGRIVFYQSQINLARKVDYRRLQRWANAETSETRLSWWEVGAACGSSLALFAHVAAAASPVLSDRETELVENLYWPWGDALHTMLDSLVDRAEDAAAAQHNLLDHYASQAEMTERLWLLAGETAQRAREVAPHHRLILAGMVALYLSDERAWTAFARPATERVLEATGAFAKPSMLLLCARRMALRGRRRFLPPPLGG